MPLLLDCCAEIILIISRWPSECKLWESTLPNAGTNWQKFIVMRKMQNYIHWQWLPLRNEINHGPKVCKTNNSHNSASRPFFSSGLTVTVLVPRSSSLGSSALSCLGSLICVLGWHTSLSHCFPPPRDVNGYWQIKCQDKNFITDFKKLWFCKRNA